ncbi:hypothetical protein PsorP6_010007 [Peronosclerospora sorghi]|uniref:Uncharacterized protein n=1 Tax=Peronosclerospora sorghi TaxID=230839 RepID=A0ACC0VX61_9STRA|nr:hypothetical protein PsorP6_010007 [Peronosclerospora sorghi]
MPHGTLGYVKKPVLGASNAISAVAFRPSSSNSMRNFSTFVSTTSHLTSTGFPRVHTLPWLGNMNISVTFDKKGGAFVNYHNKVEDFVTFYKKRVSIL